MKILTVLGARPQFVKAAPVCSAIQEAGHEEVLIHTGQHYDYSMSEIFFEELGIRPPAQNLGIGSGSHGQQTGEMLIRLEEAMEVNQPDWVLIYGDTNSTLAAALAACKLRFPIAHVEAGLRSRNRDMPEEHNRIVADHVSDLLLCPTQAAVDNLAQEALRDRVHLVGDTMYDAVLTFQDVAARRSDIHQRLQLPEGTDYYVATVHRPYNTDNPDNLSSIAKALSDLPYPVIVPLHPRTRARLADIEGTLASSVRLIDPVGYLDMLALSGSAKAILTDSGGLQKEAFFLRVPCVTLRTETEWGETVDSGWNVVAGAHPGRIAQAITDFETPPVDVPSPFGDGHASHKIVSLLAAGG